MSGYVFIGNSTKPTLEVANSRNRISPTNVSAPCIEAALALGYDVFLGVNRNNAEELECTYPIKLYDAHSYRSLLAVKDNRIAYHNLVKLIKKNNVDVIHCNTPIGGMIGRFAGRRCRVNTIIYTAHGFNFCKQGSLLNNTVVKLAEKIMARWTDAIITMNEEDFAAAKRFKMKKGGKVFFVHGVGIESSSYLPNQSIRRNKRMELGLSDQQIMLISAGDLVDRKNYTPVIKALSQINDKNIHYYICGKGPKEQELKLLAKTLHVEDKVHFLGFRTDMKELYQAADIFVFSSILEGLPRCTMEAMASGLPCIVSKIRGNVDLIKDNKNGLLCSPSGVEEYAEKIKYLASSKDERMRMGNNNLQIIKQYDIAVVRNEIKSIYAEILT